MSVKPNESREQRSEKFRVLFLCSGNTCRSPMARVILEDLLAGTELEGRVEVDSAGIMARDGFPASHYAVEAGREAGLELANHRSKGLTDELIARADLIVVMQSDHRLALRHYLMAREKEVVLLGEFCGRESGIREISDPYGGELEVYRRTFQEIHDCARGIIEYLSHILGQEQFPQ